MYEKYLVVGGKRSKASVEIKHVKMMPE